jgi:hypothetical protein
MIRKYEAADADRVNAVALAAFAQFNGIYSDWGSPHRRRCWI